MEEQDIMQLWKSYSVKLDESLQLNRKMPKILHA